MDDDRGPDRRSSPDALASARKRKASRGLRVPNDPVPRASQPGAARVSITANREIDEFGDRVTQVQSPSAEGAALIDAASKSAHGHSPDAERVDNTSAAPPLIVPIDLDASRENEHLATVEDHSIEEPSPLAAERKSLSSGRLIAVVDEAPSSVRQVRRKIRAIGSDDPRIEADTATSDAPQLEQFEEEAEVDAIEDVDAAPTPSAVEASAFATMASAVVAADTRSSTPTDASSSDIAIETISSPAEEHDEVPVESAELEDEESDQAQSPPPARETSKDEGVALRSPLMHLDAALKEDDAPQVDAEVEASAEVEVEEEATSVEVEEPTEEITIPDDLQAKPAAPPPRTTAPDGTRPPPPPRTAPTERPTMVGAEAKPRRRHWWEEIFNDDYLRTQRRYTPQQTASEGDFIEASLGVEKGASVLDVGCGVGRQAVELATRGYEVLGLDLSLAMLSRASDTAQSRGAKLNFLQSDMLEMEFSALFDAAYCVGSTFGFFDDDKNADVIQRLHRALKPGGTLLLEVVNRDCAAGQHPAMTWYEADGCVCMEETQFNWFTSRLEGKRTLLLEDGRQREQKFSLRLYSLHELGKLLNSAGFRVIEVSGHQKTPGAFFGTHSMMLIILAQKRADEG
jgi:ubiquinone/menaquinone biosynthesis C-methylase UbiE